MSTQIQENITKAYVDFKTSLSLVEGVTYTIQNTGTGDLVISEALTTPTELRGVVLAPDGFLSITINTNKMFTRSPKGNGELAVTEG